MATMTPTCDICTTGQNVPEAFVNCGTCKQNVCKSCLNYHQKFNATLAHKVTILPPIQQSSPQVKSNIYCSRHGKKNEFFCDKHHETCCEDCIKDRHSECESIKNYSEYINQTEDIKKNCESMIKKLTFLKTSLEQKVKDTKISEQQWKERINANIASMRTTVQELEDKINIKKRDMMQRNQDMEVALRAYSDALTVLKSSLEELQNCSTECPESDKAQAVVQVAETIKRFEPVLHDAGQGHTIAHLKAEHEFEAEHFVSGTIQHLFHTVEAINSTYTEMQRNSVRRSSEVDQPQSMSSTYVKTRHVTERPRSGDRPGSGERPKSGDRPLSGERHRTLSQNLEHYQSLVNIKETETAPTLPVQSECQLDIHSNDDRGVCGITGIAELANGHLLIADFLNFKLKLCNNTGEIIEENMFEKEPRDIAVVDENHVIVSIPKAKCIQPVTVLTDGNTGSGYMTFPPCIKVNGMCCGVAYANQKIFTATQFPTQILILDMNGQVIKSISGDNLFERPTYIAVDPEIPMIYVSDPNHKCVYGIDIAKKEAFRYAVEGPHGITLDNDGHLLVADFDTGTVHQVSRSGSSGVKIAELRPEKDLHCPQKVFYSKTRDRLIISMWQANTIRTFQLKKVRPAAGVSEK